MRTRGTQRTVTSRWRTATGIALALAGLTVLAGYLPKGDAPSRRDSVPLPPASRPQRAPAPTPETVPAPPPRAAPLSVLSNPKQRGVALGLFAEDISFDYQPLLDEIAALGASHVALIVPLYQQHGGSTEIGRHTRFSPTLEAIADAIRGARRANLEVTLFPIVRLLAPRGPNEWRGTLAPADVAAWFRSYEAALGDLAALATFTGATRLVIGSELSTLDNERAHWRPLLERVRGLFSGTLLYSANWDHYRDAGLLDLVDEIGVTAYFELRRKDGPADVVSLTGRWRELRAELERWAGPRGKPFVFTEVGYRSRAGSSASPWDETPGGTPDPDEQARAFDAFRRAWAGAHTLAGIYVWNWYGYGGPNTLGYTPRGKPAAAVVKQVLEEL